MNVLLLAAGLGTRLRPYTDKTPKPAIPFMTVPLAYYPLHLCQDLNIQNLVVNVHHLPEQIESLMGEVNWPCKKLVISDERNKILGSGGAIKKAKTWLETTEHFVYANADEVTLPDFDWSILQMLHAHQKSQAIATLLTVEHPEVGKKFGGVWADPKSHQIFQISKDSRPGAIGWHFTGVMILSKKIFDYFVKPENEEEHIFQDTLAHALACGEKAFVYPIKATWFETGNPQDFLQATTYCCEKISSGSQEPCVKYLKSILRLHSQGQMILENDHAEVANQLRVAIKNL